jgi:molybdopterin-containing oxidoreductase family membrane subunit
VGVLAFVWRIILTTGTGSIFGFLIARPGYASAVIAPLFIALSLAWGTAVFIVVKEAVCRWYGMPTSDEMRLRLRRLLGIFVAAALYLTVVHHLTNLYWAKQMAFERFFLLDGGIYTVMFWVGFVLLGSIVPLWLTLHPRFKSPRALMWACWAVVEGGLAFLYSFIIAGQAFPLDMFPGYEVTSGFRDGVVAPYVPRLPEFLLGFGGVALAFLIALVVIRLFKVVPRDEMPVVATAVAASSPAAASPAPAAKAGPAAGAK